MRGTPAPSRSLWPAMSVAGEHGRSGGGLQPQPPRPHGGLALHPPVGGERGGHRADAGRVRARDPAPVPRRRQAAGRIVLSAPAATPPGASAPEADSRSWTVKLRRRAVAALPPEKLLPDGQPTYVASWIYVFGVASIASLIVLIASGCVLALKGPAWWHYTERRALLQQHPPVVGGAVLLRDGRAPVGQVLDGRLARRARPRVGDGRDHVPGGRAGGPHRLRLPAELRRAVDLHAGQGRAQRGRGRGLLQRHQLRPDVQLAHPAAADRGRGARERPRAARAPPRRRAAVRARAETRRRPPRPPAADAPPQAPTGATT